MVDLETAQPCAEPTRTPPPPAARPAGFDARSGKAWNRTTPTPWTRRTFQLAPPRRNKQFRWETQRGAAVALEAQALTAPVYATFHALCERSDGRGKDITISQARLGEYTAGRCDRTVRRHLRILEAVGFIETEHHTYRLRDGTIRQHPNTYRLHLPEQWRRVKAPTGGAGTAKPGTPIRPRIPVSYPEPEAPEITEQRDAWNQLDDDTRRKRREMVLSIIGDLRQRGRSDEQILAHLTDAGFYGPELILVGSITRAGP